MPFFGNFGSKKKSKSSSNLTPEDQGLDNQRTGGWIQQNQQWGGHTASQWEGQGNTHYLNVAITSGQLLSFAGSEESADHIKLVNKLERKNRDLEEENNMLKLKVEILLDMLAQKTAETSLQESEIDRLQTTVEMMSPSRLRLI